MSATTLAHSLVNYALSAVCLFILAAQWLRGRPQARARLVQAAGRLRRFAGFYTPKHGGGR